VILAGSLAYSLLRSPKQERVASLTYAPGAVAKGARKGAAAPKAEAREGALNLALLDRELPRFSGYKRNIFSPIFRDEVKPPPFKPLPPPPKPLKAPVPAPAPAPVPAPPAPPPPSPEELARQAAEAELSRFTFLGFLKKDGQKTVFLSKNNEIFLAKKGSTLAGRFQISELTDDAITIRATAGGKELVIPLIENRALGARQIK
jgi:hypothetical protein